MKTPISKLEKIGACKDARDWIKSRRFQSLESAWLKCERGDWMLWYAGKMSGEPESDGRKKLVLAACKCARLALNRTSDPRVLACIETAEAWANGKATIEEVHRARIAAYAAAAAAAYAYDAAAAAAAAYAAAAYATARKNTLRRCAKIVRKHYPKLPTA